MVDSKNKQTEIDLKEWAKDIVQTFKCCSKRDFTTVARQEFRIVDPEELGEVLTVLVKEGTARLGIVPGLAHEGEIVILPTE